MTTPAGPNPTLAPYADPAVRRARFAVHPRPLRALPHVDGLLAGAVDVDITPPPGLPKAGYSANAHDGSGFRTRLRAHVIHLRSGTASLALVCCDLLGGSAVLQHLVAEAIAERTDIPLAGVYIGATHTHAGPGQYLGTDFYNRFASNRSGFDPAFASFLVQRISEGISDAHDQRGPAALAVGTTTVWGLTRNRSLRAHVRNRGVTNTSTEPQQKFHAINPRLHLIRVDRVTGTGIGADTGDTSTTTTEPLAAMAVFSVHGTGVPMTADEYNADIWAYLKGELRHRIQAAHGHDAVVGAVEGTHADVAPAIRPGTAGHLEAARLGRAIGAHGADLYEDLAPSLRRDVVLGAALREIDLRRDRTIDGIELPKRPAVGAALIAGAHENVTPVVHHIPPFAPGTPKRWGRPHAQGTKWVIGTRWLQPIVLRLDHFPRVLPVHALRIDGAVLVGLPFEITVETGKRIEAAVADALDHDGSAPDVDRVIVTSVANEYCGYAATADEYEIQHYEGAHTLYGPKTQPFLAAHAARLTRELTHQSMVQDVLDERRFDLKVKHHLPRRHDDDGDAPTRGFATNATFVDPTRFTDGYWYVEFDDVEPAALDWHEPLVRVEERVGSEWRPAHRGPRTIDDQAWDLQVSHLGARAGADSGTHVHRYALRWWDPVFRGGQPFRFVLVPNAGRPEVASPPFA